MANKTETEVKVLEIDKRQILSLLGELGAKRHYSGNICSISYECRNGTFRLRKMRRDCYIGHKSKQTKKGMLKIAREIEVCVNSFNKMSEILDRVGFRKKKVINKERTSYFLKGTVFDIDKVPGIPYYMEIEGKPRDIRKYIKKLQLPLCKVKPWGTLRLLDYYSKKD